MNMIFDTHAHYDDEAFDEDRDELLKGLNQQGVGIVVNIASSLKTTKNTIHLMEQYPFIYGAAGVHPDEVGELNEENFDWLRKIIKQKKYEPEEFSALKNSALSAPDLTQMANKIVAIGEIGLDYYWDTVEREVQKQWFYRQLLLAIEENLPVVIHSRDAAEDTLNLVKQANTKAKSLGKELRGVIHCFSYGIEAAREYTSMGFYIGVGGVVTFKNAKKLVQVVTQIPLEQIVLETDCPYLSPDPNRGKRNSSLNLCYVAKRIAELKNITKEEVIDVTTQNAMKLYQLVSKN